MTNAQVPSSAIARTTIRCTASFTTSNSSSVLKSRSAWKLPSPTCPTIVYGSPMRSRSFFVSSTSSGSFVTGTLYFHQFPSHPKLSRRTKIPEDAPNIRRPALCARHDCHARMVRVLSILPYIVRLFFAVREPEPRPAVLHAYLFDNARRLSECGRRVPLELEKQPI